MIRGCVQSIKVVENLFDFRTAGSNEAHTAEDVAALFHGLGKRMFASCGSFSSGESDIQHFCGISTFGSCDTVFCFVEKLSKFLLGFIESASHLRFVFGGDFTHQRTECCERSVSADCLGTDSFHGGSIVSCCESFCSIFNDCLNLFQEFHK